MTCTMYTNIKRFYDESGRASPYVTLTYMNWTYSRNSVKNVSLLWDEVKKDFPELSPEDVFLVWKKTFPHEVGLAFSVKMEQLNHIKRKCEELPKEIIKFRRVMSCSLGSIKKVYTIEEGETTYINFVCIRWGNPANTLDVYFSLLEELKADNPNVDEDNIFVEQSEGNLQEIFLTFVEPEEECDIHYVQTRYEKQPRWMNL